MFIKVVIMSFVVAACLAKTTPEIAEKATQAATTPDNSVKTTLAPTTPDSSVKKPKAVPRDPLDNDPLLTYAVNRVNEINPVMRYFEPGWDVDQINYATENRMGKWTVFLDADMPWGIGEYENIWRAKNHYMEDCRALWCNNPVAMDVALSDSVLRWNPNATIENAYRCTKFDSKITPSRGFHCLNLYQKPSRFPERDPECTEYICKESGMYSSCRRCFNSKVRYFCLYEDMNCRHNTFPYLI